jgi:hypothetical protein
MNKQAIFKGRKQILLFFRGGQKPGVVLIKLLELFIFLQIFELYLVTQSL